jgi:hypothetical protein
VTLRVGIDLDGTLADLSSIYHKYEDALFGSHTDEDQSRDPGEDDSASTAKEKLKSARAESRRREQVWRALRQTPDLWTLLKPIESNAVRELQAAMASHNWEVYFVTQRPKSAGRSVQLQTQKWLIEQGFEMPSVLTLSGSRGRAAHALDLDFLIDDLPKNCIDVISDSKCRPILVLREPNPDSEASARRMNIGVVRSVTEAIELLKQPLEVPRESVITNVLRRLGLAR